jgi:hypothetical protein
MPSPPHRGRQVFQLMLRVLTLAPQAVDYLTECVRSRTALAAEHLFLQHQLVLYQARHAPSRRSMNAMCLILVWLSYCFDWRLALTLVQPETFKHRRRQGWRLLWSAPAKPGLQVSPQTVRKYMPRDCVGAPGQRRQSQRWSTFVRNHARVLIISGVAADLTRSLQVLSARLMRLVQDWRDRSVARALLDPASHEAASLAQPRDTGSGPAVWSPDIVHVIGVDEGVRLP